METSPPAKLSGGIQKALRKLWGDSKEPPRMRSGHSQDALKKLSGDFQKAFTQLSVLHSQDDLRRLSGNSQAAVKLSTRKF